MQTAAGTFNRFSSTMGTTGENNGAAANLDLLVNTFYPTFTTQITLTDIDAMQEAQKAPDDPHPLLQNKSFNEFVSLLKEALAMWRAGYSNKRISGTITVTFGF
jgi:hypothetical protein